MIRCRRQRSTKPLRFGILRDISVDFVVRCISFFFAFLFFFVLILVTNNPGPIGGAQTSVMPDVLKFSQWNRNGKEFALAFGIGVVGKSVYHQIDFVQVHKVLRNNEETGTDDFVDLLQRRNDGGPFPLGDDQFALVALGVGIPSDAQDDSVSECRTLANSLQMTNVKKVKNSIPVDGSSWATDTAPIIAPMPL